MSTDDTNRNSQNGTDEYETEFDLAKVKGIIEAVLFTMGDSVPLSSLADAAGISETALVPILADMQEQYKAEDRGIKIIELDGSYQMCTKPEYFPEIIRVAKEPKKPVLTETLLETLAIVAYRQPVTKQEIEKVRGVSCDHAVNRLVEFGLIEEAGRLPAPGRPLLFRTTESFLRVFGLTDLSMLPEPTSGQWEEFKYEAIKEAGEDDASQS